MRASRQRERQALEQQKRFAEARMRQSERLVRETISRIAETLGETEERQRRQIARVVEVLGMELALALLDETLQIEASGGMTTADGSRRRTPGGVYLTLLKQRLVAEGRKDDLKKII